MAILAECPVCHRKQTVRNKLCFCGEILDRAKKAERVIYWIDYRLNGKQRRECVGKSIVEARDADGKRRSQKRENRIFDVVPDAKMNFSQLAAWYIERDKVRGLSSFKRVRICLEQFNRTFGGTIVGKIKQADLEDYQQKRLAEGKSQATVDMELSVAGTMINRAFDNDMVGPHVVRAFRRVDRVLSRGNNARERKLTPDEYRRLQEHLPRHLRGILTIAINTGMREGEIVNLRWSQVNLKNGFIRLGSEDTKEGKKKVIPMNHWVCKVIEAAPRAIHHDFVFTYRREPFNDMRTGFQVACKRAGIPYGHGTENGLVFHDIRRTAKTGMLTAGVDRTMRDILLGHSLNGMDAYYIRPSEDELTAAMDKFTRWLNEAFFGFVDQTVDQDKERAHHVEW